MFTDIVIPKGNEKELVDMAKKLGYAKLIFVYPFKLKGSDKGIKNDNIITKTAMLIKKKDLIKPISSDKLSISKAGILHNTRKVVYTLRFLAKNLTQSLSNSNCFIQ